MLPFNFLSDRERIISSALVSSDVLLIGSLCHIKVNRSCVRLCTALKLELKGGVRKALCDRADYFYFHPEAKMEGVSQWGRGADVQWHWWICREVQNVEKPSHTSTRLPLFFTTGVHALYNRVWRTRFVVWWIHKHFKSQKADVITAVKFGLSKTYYNKQGRCSGNIWQTLFYCNHVCEMTGSENRKEKKIWPLINTNPKSWSSKLINNSAFKSADCKCDGTGEHPAVDLYSSRLR